MFHRSSNRFGRLRSSGSAAAADTATEEHEIASASEKVTILVCGAGPVGLTAALECARHGLQVKIIDKSLTKDPHSKAFGIHALTMEKFLAMGVAPAVLEQAHCVDRLRIRGDFTTVVEDFCHIPSRFKGVFMLSQRKLEDILEAHIHMYGIEVERGVELLDFVQAEDQSDASGTPSVGKGPMTANLRDVKTGEERNLTCKYVIGCDGCHSRVRKLLKLPFLGAPYEEDFLLLDVHFSVKPGQRFQGSSVLLGDPVIALFELDCGLLRFISKRCAGDGIPASQDDKRIADVENAAVEAAILKRFQDLVLSRCPELAGLHDVKWASIFRIHRRVVPQYNVGHVFLAGDAAHIHSPLGGQGLNTGIHDAVNLAWKLGAVERLGADPGILLPSYNAERHPVGEQTLAWTDSLTSYTITRGFLSGVAQKVLFPIASPLLNRSTWAMKAITSRMRMLSLSYRGPPSPLLPSAALPASSLPPIGSPQPGDRVPDGPLVRFSSGAATGLLEVVCRGLDHTLLMFGEPEGMEGLEGVEDGLTVEKAVRSKLDLEVEAWRRLRDMVSFVHISRRFRSASKSVTKVDARGSSSRSHPRSSHQGSNGGAQVRERSDPIDKKSSGGRHQVRQPVALTSMYDESGRVSEAFGLNTSGQSGSRGNPACLFLVRPDGYVGWRAGDWDLGGLLTYLEPLYPRGLCDL